MRCALIICFVALLVSSLWAPSVSAQEAITGQWLGVASRQGADLPIEFNFLNDSTGLKAFVTARTLGGLNFPLRNVSFDSPNLRFELPTDAGVFRFSGSVRGDSLTGSWNLFGFESQVSMRRTLNKPPPYTQVEAKCRNGDVELAGTLFLPTSRRSQHPALVFLHGSGTVPRDANRFLADHFARKGVATLIFDKRGSGASTGNWREADFNDLARDALACVQLLKSRRDINGRKIGLIGASQAGWVAPLAASMSRDVAFMVLISAPTVTVAREGWWDAEFRLRESGFTHSEIDQALTLLRMNDEVTRNGRGLAELQAAVEHARGERWFGALDFGTPQPIDSRGRRWYRRVIDFDPVPILQKVFVSSLWIYGGRDQTVPAMESVAILERLKAQGKNLTIRVFQTADHTLFVKSKEGEPFRWPGFAPGYLDALTDWVLRRVNLRARQFSHVGTRDSVMQMTILE